MPGSIAAIKGVKKGVTNAKATARFQKREEFSKLRRQTAKRYEAQKQVIIGLMQKYDKDQSGKLCEEEIITMLNDYQFDLLGKPKTAPTKEEVAALILLCDKDHDDRISGQEVLDSLSTWLAYIEKGEETVALLKKHDVNLSGTIDKKELRPLLSELNDGNGVPDDVVAWIWSQADLNGDRTLCQMELTRAIAAWYVWLPEDQEGNMGMLKDGINTEKMPEQRQPQSQCCVVSLDCLVI